MLFDNTQIFLQVFLEMIGASHTDFRWKDKNWKSDEFVGLHIVCGWVLGLFLHFSCTLFRQKPGKCNHASKVATTLIANRLLAPKNPRDASGIYPKIIHSARISPIFAPNQSSSIYCIAKPLRNETAFIPQRFYCFYVR